MNNLFIIVFFLLSSISFCQDSINALISVNIKSKNDKILWDYTQKKQMTLEKDLAFSLNGNNISIKVNLIVYKRGHGNKFHYIEDIKSDFEYYFVCNIQTHINYKNKIKDYAFVKVIPIKTKDSIKIKPFVENKIKSQNDLIIKINFDTKN